MAKSIDFDSGGIGDVDRIMHNQSVSDLSWLSINEEEYRASEALPKQNLDIIEDLQHALVREEGDDVPKVLPLRPYVMVNSNEQPYTYQNIDSQVIKKTASYVIDQEDPRDLVNKLILEFPKNDLQRLSSDISRLVKERGLLGNVYVVPEHLDRCHNPTGRDKGVLSNSKRSLFVVASNKCSGCVCNSSGNCTSLKKRIVSSVNYTPKLASHYFPTIAPQSRLSSILASGNDWKSRIQNAFLLDWGVTQEHVKTVHTQAKVSTKVYSEAEMVAALDMKKNKDEGITATYAKYARRMIDGKDDREYLRASGDVELTRLASEYGLIGHTYLDMDAVGGCGNALQYVNRISTLQYALRRSSVCSKCRNMSDGDCHKISSIIPIFHNVQPVSSNTLKAALINAKNIGKISTSQLNKAMSRISSVKNPTEIIKGLYGMNEAEEVREYQGTKYKNASMSVSSEHSTVTRVDIERTVGHLLNTGVSGPGLVRAIQSRYASADLRSHPDLAVKFSQADGVQGYYHIDPSVYPDYGSGCDVGAKHFRKQGASHVLACSKCVGCKLQSAPGWCSKYSKTLVASVPNHIIESAKSLKSLPVISQKVEPNIVDKYELGATIEVDLSGAADRSLDFNIDSHYLGD